MTDPKQDTPFITFNVTDIADRVTEDWLRMYGFLEMEADETPTPGVWSMFDEDGTARITLLRHSDSAIAWSATFEDGQYDWPHDIHARDQVYLLVHSVFC